MSLSARIKKTLGHFVRVAICVVAVVLVAREVTWCDRVELADGTVLVGIVAPSVTPDYVVRTEAVERTLSRAQIASDSDGSPRITYGVRSTWTRARKPLLLASILVQLPVVLPLAARFRVLLSAQGIALRFVECLKLSFAGNFLNFATPLGSNAGDVFRAYFVSLHTPNRKTEAVAAVILDRAIGLGTLLVIAALIACASPTGSVIASLRGYLLMMAAMGIVVVGFYFSPVGHRLIARVEGRSHHPVFQQMHRLDRAARTLLANPAVVASAIAWTILLQVLALTGYFLVALALSFDAGLAQVCEFFGSFYVGAVVQALPGPPQGLGTVELAYRYMFAGYAGPSQIVCMALTIRLINLLCALPGLWVTMTGSYRPASLDEVEALPLPRQETFPTPSPDTSQQRSGTSNLKAFAACECKHLPNHSCIDASPASVSESNEPVSPTESSTASSNHWPFPPLPTNVAKP